MPNAAGTLETLALELGNALKPLKDLLTVDIFVRLGLQLPDALAGNAAISTKLGQAAAKAGELEPKIQSLATAINGNDATNILSAAVPLIAKIAELIVKLKELGDALHAAANTLPAAEKAKFQEMAGQMATRILEYMTVGYLDEKMPTLTSSLALLGLVDKEPKIPETLETPSTKPEIVPRRIYFDKIPKLFEKPDLYLQDVFKWNTPAFESIKLLKRVQALLESLGLPADLYQIGAQPSVLEAYFFSVQVDTTVNPPGLKFEFNLPGNTDYNQTVSFSDLWKGTVQAKAAFAAGIEATLHPPFNLNVKPPTGNLTLDLLLGLKAEKTPADPVILLGVTGGTRLQAKSIGGAVGVNISVGTSGGEVNPAIQINIEEGKLILDFSQGDGFLKQILEGIQFEAGFTISANWNPKKGLKFEGSGGIEIFLPLHLNLVIIEVEGLYFSIGFSTDAPIQIGVATQFKTNLGPLQAVVDQLGVAIPIAFPANGQGNLGIADISFKFKPPKGVGLSLDTGVIKGGGFLFLDYEKGEYAGALELTFQGFIELKAIGIINTKMPDGSDGFSLLIIITAEFTPIQLGFGFTLNGIGGLLGLNRTTKIEALREGVRTNAIKSILFPENVIANINRIISDLKQIFPPYEGHFIIGPMAKLGWGTPSIITLELGILIELPAPRIAILGVLKALLPEENTALIRIQVNFLGVIDFQNKYISFDATLFDSRILILTLSGDMAFRLSWGDNPMFILSVGGFHPAFREIPDDLTKMRRLTISLLSGNNPRLTVEAYFAVTSNTVQFGAKVELYAAAAGFNIYGFLGFDVLFQFDPFKFIASIAAGIALRRGTSVLMGIRVAGQLSGPKPWDVKGEASFSILFFDITISFHVTWGDRADKVEAAKVNVLELLRKELQDVRNWKADIPDTNNLHVSVKEIKQPDDKLIIHPFGVITFSERLVPLDYNINKFGNKKPDGDSKFEIKEVKSGANTLTTQPVKEQFAPANFTELSDSDKISRKSYEQMNSGFKIAASSALTIASIVEKSVDYELSYLVKKKRFVGGIFRFAKYAFQSILKGSAVSKSTLSYQVNKVSTTAPLEVKVNQDKYAIANVSDLKMHQAGLIAESQAEAYQLYQQLIVENPALKDEIQVVSQFELNEV